MFLTFYVHCRYYKSPPIVPLPSQNYPVHAVTSYGCKNNFNIILPSTSISSKWSLSFIPKLYSIHLTFIPSRCVTGGKTGTCPSINPKACSQNTPRPDAVFCAHDYGCRDMEKCCFDPCLNKNTCQLAAKPSEGWLY